MDDDKQDDRPMNVMSAIVQVMSSLGTLSKDNKNKFDKYEYASIDDFIAFVREHVFAAGLVIEQNELEARLVDVVKKDGKSMAMWWAEFAFTLHHVGGTTLGPIKRSVMVQANGAQAAGSAQSYALKQFMRSQFLIPTGDGDDPDKEKTQISADRGERETDLQKKASRIRREYLKAQTVDELKEAQSFNAVTLDEIKRASETAHEFLAKEYSARMVALQGEE